jgi:aminoglycoside 6'-N-acetyltransferase
MTPRRSIASVDPIAAATVHRPAHNPVMIHDVRGLPVLRGDRVTLRAGTADDAPALRRVFGAPDVARWWPLPTEPELDELLHNGDPDVDVWLIEVDGRVVGLIQAYEEHDPMYRHAGIDIVLHPEAQGRRLGAEAIRVLARHLFDDRGHHRLVIDPNAANARAIHVYERLGFRRVGILREYEWSEREGRWTDGLLMDPLRGELVED